MIMDFCKNVFKKITNAPPQMVFNHTPRNRSIRLNAILLGRQKFRRGYFYPFGGRKY